MAGGRQNQNLNLICLQSFYLSHDAIPRGKNLPSPRREMHSWTLFQAGWYLHSSVLKKPRKPWFGLGTSRGFPGVFWRGSTVSGILNCGSGESWTVGLGTETLSLSCSSPRRNSRLENLVVLGRSGHHMWRLVLIPRKGSWLELHPQCPGRLLPSAALGGTSFHEVMTEEFSWDGSRECTLCQ